MNCSSEGTVSSGLHAWQFHITNYEVKETRIQDGRIDIRCFLILPDRPVREMSRPVREMFRPVTYLPVPVPDRAEDH